MAQTLFQRVTSAYEGAKAAVTACEGLLTEMGADPTQIRARGRPPRSPKLAAGNGSKQQTTDSTQKLGDRVWAKMSEGPIAKADLIKAFPNDPPNHVGAAIGRYLKKGLATQDGEKRISVVAPQIEEKAAA